MSLPNPPSGPLSVLQYRDFRLLWAGQVFSLIGTRMQAAAMAWHIYQLSGYSVERAAVYLGTLGLARLVPMLLFSMIGGAAADALDRRRMMILSQSAMAAIAAGLGVWTLVGLTQIWPFYVVAALNAAAFAFDGPARQSMLPNLVPKERLANAVSLNSISMQVASIAGPALMGLLVARFSIGVVYCLNALSFGAVLAALFVIRLPAREDSETRRPQVNLQSIQEGFRFIRSAPLLLSLMVLDFLATLFGSATALLPIYTREILKGDIGAYGILYAADSVGSFIAAVVMTSMRPVRRQGVVVLCAVCCYGLATIGFGLSTWFPLSALMLGLVGASDTVSTVLRQTIRQMTTPDELRGRMTSINMLFFAGGPQLGELEAGLVARAFGPVFSVVSGGVAAVLSALAVARFAPWLVRYEAEEAK
jgi:MFS family permease